MAATSFAVSFVTNAVYSRQPAQDGSRGCCYPCAMAVRFQIHDLPDELHQQEHGRQPTLDEWLDGLSRLTPVSLSTPAAEAVPEAREAEDAALTDALEAARS